MTDGPSGLSFKPHKETIMTVLLSRPYAGFASGATISTDPATEAALVAQGLAVYTSATAISPAAAPGVSAWLNQFASAPILGTYGPSILPNMPLGNTALTAAGTSSVHVAGTLNISEIFVPHWNTWKGLAVLNGTVVGTDNMLVALYSSSGALLANSAVAGTLSAGASTFQSRDFLAPVTLAPGRYFCGVQSNGTTATSNKFVTANGVNVLTTSSTGTFGTVPASITVPTTFTTAVGCVCQLYTV
jgi:hypothetical protein